MLRLASSMLRLSWCVPWVVMREVADAVLPAQYRVRAAGASRAPGFSSRNQPSASAQTSPPVDRSQPDHGYGTAPTQSSSPPVIATGPIEQENNMTTTFYDTNVTTVDYQIIFTKRNCEAVLEKDTTAVAKAMTGSGFASWKIAEFIRRMELEGIKKKPDEWTPKDFKDLTDGPADSWKLKKENFEYLQVEYQVLSTLDRKPAKYEQEKVDALQQIAREIKEK